MAASFALAVPASLFATLLFYLGCNNQQWWQRRPLPTAVAVSGSLFLTCVAWLILRQQLAVLPATFSVLSLLMLFLALWPFLGRLPAPVAVDRRDAPLGKGGDVPSAQWVGKILAVLLLGFPLALSLVGLLAWLAPGSLTHNGKSQLVMWLVTPLWLTPLTLVFFRLRLRTLLASYLLLNVLAYLLLGLAQRGA